MYYNRCYKANRRKEATICNPKTKLFYMIKYTTHIQVTFIKGKQIDNVYIL